MLCIEGSPPSYLLSFAYKGLFLVCFKVLMLLFIISLFNCSGEHLFHSSNVNCGRYNGSCRGMSGLQAIIIVFSIHLGEPLVMDLTMLSFISLPYIVLHHTFQFLCLISFSEFISGWQSCDSRYNDWLFWLFFLSWNLHVLPYVSLQLLGPWSFLQIPCLEDSNFFL